MDRKEKSLYLLFTESLVGVHAIRGTSIEKYENYPLTFPVSAEETNGNYQYKTALLKNKTFNEVLKRYRETKPYYKDVTILVGFDLDRMGELMSGALRASLEASGVEGKDVFRTPLTEDGYIVVKSFAKHSFYLKVLYWQEQLMSILRKAGIKKNVGFAKAFSLKYALKNAGQIFGISNASRINKQGTSTATVVTKFFQKEKEAL
ncbi:MAG: hypothetical protein IE916_00640 [Epsilonproteobacteria bacterium]|nr:hypothetical protein [Campylobacterota bacterium]